MIYDSLKERIGYKRDFLGGQMLPPSLTAAGRAVVTTINSSHESELKYHHFSVWLHSERRLALLTASNVSYKKTDRIPPGYSKPPTRAQLNGHNTVEQWVHDARVPREAQIPSVFYDFDDGAFDKGHLVRRDDVCWGDSFDDIQMANGDTFHVPNCSPQIAELNQSSKGEYNWGDFENFVARQSAGKLSVIFAGPVLAPNDRWFASPVSGYETVQVPTSFWKIVVVRNSGAFAAFGFVFEQDITSITSEESFRVPQDWVFRQVAIRDIKALCRGWLDFAHLEAIDHYRD